MKEQSLLIEKIRDKHESGRNARILMEIDYDKSDMYMCVYVYPHVSMCV